MRSWTSRGSTSLICCLICRISSAPLGIALKLLKTGRHYFNKCSEARSRCPEMDRGAPWGTSNPRPKTCCGSQSFRPTVLHLFRRLVSGRDPIRVGGGFDQREAERGSPAGSVRELDLPAVALGHLTHDRETQSRA